MKYITFIIIICLITSCAGRKPRPVDAMKVTDKEMYCNQFFKRRYKQNV